MNQRLRLKPLHLQVNEPSALDSNLPLLNSSAKTTVLLSVPQILTNPAEAPGRTPASDPTGGGERMIDMLKRHEIQVLRRAEFLGVTPFSVINWEKHGMTPPTATMGRNRLVTLALLSQN